MRWALTILFSLALFVSTGSAADTTTGKVIKVLPQYLDAQGRNTLSPSLYERDAYQAELLHHPDQRGGLIFNVQWKAAANTGKLKLYVQARGIVKDKTVKTYVWGLPVQKHGWFSQWAIVTANAEEFKALGTLTAWRVTLWDGNHRLGEQHSYLW
jgi:hypothetical protein